MRDRKLYDGTYRLDLKHSYFTQCNRLLKAMDEPIMGNLDWSIHTLETLEWELIRLLRTASLPETHLNTKKHHHRRRHTGEKYVIRLANGRWCVLIRKNRLIVLFRKTYGRKDAAVRGRDRFLKKHGMQLIKGVDL